MRILIEIEQTILTAPLGNCYAACIASVLEIPLDRVPSPTEHEGSAFAGWQEYEARVDAAVLAPRGLQLLSFKACEEMGAWTPRGFSLLGAQSPRSDWLHSVVCYDGEIVWDPRSDWLHSVVCYDGEIVWDPHPTRDQGTGERVDWTVFCKLDPAK